MLNDALYIIVYGLWPYFPENLAEGLVGRQYVFPRVFFPGHPQDLIHLFLYLQVFEIFLCLGHPYLLIQSGKGNARLEEILGDVFDVSAHNRRAV